MSDQPLVIEISQEPIPLCQLLKIANLVSGGGEAKIVISEGYVLLNNEIEYQKRKKVYADDIVEFNGELIQVVVNFKPKEKTKIVKIPAYSPIDTKTKTKIKAKSTNQKQEPPALKTTQETKSKRRSISF